MEHHRQNISSTYLEDPIELLRRQPLSDSAGNSQLQDLASIELYHGSKRYRPWLEKPMYSSPTVPSQPSRQPVANILELRRQSTRRRRALRCNPNPIVDSPQYQAYRQRQNRDGNVEDAKWPEILEMAFLDALMFIPAMGRRKFTYNGKPHGRNELIKVYLWIAYTNSLPAGVRPDPTMERTRKQVSSHIQVLKGFLRDHPAFDQLFPSNRTAKNGFEDSFKNDPTLKALTEGRLPSKDYNYYNNQNQSRQVLNHRTPMRPSLFWLLMTSSPVPPGHNDGDIREEDLYDAGIVAHRFTGLSTQRPREFLGSISSWRRRFPYLSQLNTEGVLNCDIIHMDVALNLLTMHPPEGSELCCRTVLSISDGLHHDDEWRIVTTLNRPPELCRDQITDPPVEREAQRVEVTPISSVEAQVKLPFPAESWAKTFTCLTNLQAQYDDKRKMQSYGSNSTPKPVRSYVDQISMYQEVQSSGPDLRHWLRRAIILWTFHQAGDGENSGTNWRYLDAVPQRSMCMSPSPHPSHQVSASMNENFNNWAEPTPNLLHPCMHDPFVQGIARPPNTGGLQSAFDGPSFGYSNQDFDIPCENHSFVTNTTLDSESTLADNDLADIENFISHTAVNLAESDHPEDLWQLTTTGSFEVDPVWANHTVPSSTTTTGWDTGSNHVWPEASDTVNKQLAWTEDSISKHDWAPDPASSPTKHLSQCIDQQSSPSKDLSAFIDQQSSLTKQLSYNRDSSPSKLLAYNSSSRQQYDIGLSPKHYELQMSPSKQHYGMESSPFNHYNNIEQTLEAKLLPWIDSHNQQETLPQTHPSHQTHSHHPSLSHSNSHHSHHSSQELKHPIYNDHQTITDIKNNYPEEALDDHAVVNEIKNIYHEITRNTKLDEVEEEARALHEKAEAVVDVELMDITNGIGGGEEVVRGRHMEEWKGQALADDGFD